jgi:hypothetical protein
VFNGDVLVKYTWYGDADFNGQVNFDDYIYTDNGFNNGLAGWLNGDFDLNGQVDFDDYILLDLGFNSQNGTLDVTEQYLRGVQQPPQTLNLPGLRKVREHWLRFGDPFRQRFLDRLTS